MPAVNIERSTDEAVVIVTWHDICALWLKATPTLTNQREAEVLTMKVVDNWARGIGMLVVIGMDVPAPSAEVKREIDAIYRRLAPHLRGISYVVFGRGVQATMTRGILTAMKWVTRRTYPTSISDDLKKGVTWLHYTLGEDPERGTVDQFIAALDAGVRGEAPQTLRTQKQ